MEPGTYLRECLEIRRDIDGHARAGSQTGWNSLNNSFADLSHWLFPKLMASAMFSPVLKP